MDGYSGKPLEPEEVMQPDWSRHLSQALECYNVKVEVDEDDPRDIHIPESKGILELHSPEIEDPDVVVPLKMKQVNIKIEEEPKYAMLGDY